MNTGRSEEGWTLVELILSLFVLGLLLTVSVPAFTQIGERAEREMFLDFFSSDLQLAQTEAMSREREVSVEILTDERLITVRQGPLLLRKVKIPRRYQLKSNYPANRIVFRETGQVRGGKVELYLRGRLAGTVHIQVASGRPKVVTEP
ncbi:GspH/FimT family pseudopilin [Lihuaxuella thermophila]|uniref:Type II transport protein GspH n=1 Tax=Lihuaxuella thermophila TaxID=1173111 RepID=A0A1H8DIX7_9BACL|nr:GspH/FimT family pseudopilin [Lihuaxuella thermophila]SEN06487.1 Type II transport protein GspH [Lihuaxuella thermophila]